MTQRRTGNLFRAEVPDDLLTTERRAVGIFLRHFANVAAAALGSDRAVDASNIRRPDNVFCIDGARGSGKTYTLLSIEPTLDNLTRLRHSQATQWEGFFQERLKGRAKELVGPNHGPAALAHVLRIIFPGDMERSESLMESIFSAMMDKLIECKAKEQNGVNREELQNMLREKVAEGWYFAKRFGHEAIIRDSIDYKDFVTRYEAESRKASNRISAWRAFLEKYLQFHDALVLVVLLDDSDVQPRLAEDILHSIRMFMNHPKVCPVLAGNVRSMRNSLLHLAMERISGSVGALDETSRQTAQDWRRTERRSIEEYLEKVLPPAQRVFLRSPRIGRVGSEDSDFKKITKCELRDIIEARIKATREPFLDTKFALAFRRELGLEDRPSEDQHRKIEDFLSWWVFANRYAASLAPRSARQIGTFGYYFADATNADPIGSNPKRLPVMLHDVPDNYTLVQRLGDEDVNVASWLRQQELESVWVGQRKFSINKRDTYHGSYTYEYIRYRIDVGLGMPLRDNAEEAVPLGLLPRVHGRRSMRRFFQPRNMSKQQRRYGISRRIDHTAIPGNCAYFSDLSALPDISLVSPDDTWLDARRPGQWEASLAGRWNEVIDEAQDELLVRYFTGVVCNALRETDTITSASLTAELDPPDIDLKLAFGLYESSLGAEISLFANRSEQRDLFAMEEQGEPILVNWDDVERAKWAYGSKEYAGRERREPIEEPPPAVSAAKRLIALYAALVTDLRRAWHAVRIHEKAPAWMEQTMATSPEYERSSRAWIDSQSRMPLYTREMLTEVFVKSPWIENLFRLFQLKNLREALKVEMQPSESKALEERLAKVFDVTGAEPIDNMRSREEDNDYEYWRDTLRAIGRAFSKDWPVYSEGDPEKGTSGDTYLREVDLESKLHSPTMPDWPLDVSSSGASDNQRRYGREARNFVFLLNGLAPSLPAIIHANVMSRIYEAELIKSIADRQKLNPRERIERLFREALDDIKEWTKLAGLLTVSTRYVNIKCRHLFAKLLLDAAIKPTNLDRPDPSDLKKFLELCKFEPGERADEAFAHLKRLFKADRISKDLAMMPDFAPETLFGEKWMVDLVLAPIIRKDLITTQDIVKGDVYLERVPYAPDEAKNPRGMFGETEQWLWATNRCLRKLYAIVYARWSHLDRQLAPADAPEQRVRTS